MDAGAPTPDAALAIDVASELRAAPDDAGAATAQPDIGEGTTDASSQPADGDAATGTYATIIANYRSWRPLAPRPFDISAEIFGLCRTPTSAETAFAHSVHARYALLDWANATAALTIDAPAASHFAEGSVIVKEKYASPDGGTMAIAALGIMQKRAAGFDPAHGNWEFSYWTEAEGLTRDDTGACGSCHDSPSATDFVFIDDHWRTGDAGR